MFTIRTILTFATLAIMAASASAKGKVKKERRHHQLTIGFQTGKSMFLANPPKLSNGKFKLKNTATYHQLYVKKELNNHFKAETGIKYYQAPGTSEIRMPNFPAGAMLKPYSFAVPVTLQYYALPVYSKFRPYCGIGFQYSHSLTAAQNTAGLEATRSVDNGCQPRGTNSVSIIFTQGVTFEVNTKIQFTQSFHFISGSNEKTIGLDLGIGFTLP